MRTLPVGERALLIELDSAQETEAFHAELLRRRAAGELPGVREIVPAARTVLLDGLEQPAALAARLVTWTVPPLAPSPEAGVDIPVRYDGPDLAEVARRWDVEPAEVPRIVGGLEFRVAFCGFVPGFGYLTGLPDRLRLPRRATPRTSVPAGSVALADTYAGVYPRSSPGGWQADRIHRRGPVGPGPRACGPAGPRHAGAVHRGGPRMSLEVVRPGALTTVQDLGRPGYAHLGVPHSGALDRAAHRLANLLTGNAPEAATLETTLDGTAVRATADVTAAVTGAPCPVRIDGRPAAWGAPVLVPSGAVLDVGRAVGGVRSYVAFGGGIAVEPVLGSRSTDLLSGLGPAPLETGRRLPLGRAGALPGGVDALPLPAPPAELVLPLILGPRADRVTEAALRACRGPSTGCRWRATASGCAPRGRRWSAPAIPNCPARAWSWGLCRCRRTGCR